MPMKEEQKWKPGQSGNPSGRPKMPEHLRNVLKITRDEFQRTLSKQFRMKRDEIQNILDNKDSPILDLFLARIIAAGIKDGDDRKLNTLLDRLHGKPKEEIEFSSIEPRIVRRFQGGEIIEMTQEPIKEITDGSRATDKTE